MNTVNAETIPEANKILAEIRKDLKFEIREGKLWLISKYRANAARMRSDGHWLDFNTNRHGLSGTQIHSVVYLIRWIRGQHRQSIRYWRHYWGENIATMLEATDYGDSKFTSCVLCGEDKTTGDWWCDTKRVGPCCTYGRCQKEKNESDTQQT